MDNIVILNPDNETVFEKMENLYGIMGKLTKAEIKINKLKECIERAEKNRCRYRIKQNEENYSVKRPRKLRNGIVISKVYKKYKTPNDMNELIIPNEENCPQWLQMIAEGYTAIRECYWQIREELKIISHKFLKQEQHFIKISDRKFNRSPDRLAIGLKQSEEKLKARFKKNNDVLAFEIHKRTREIQEKKKKEERLKCMNGEIQREITSIVKKYAGICSQVESEIDYTEAAERHIQEYLTDALEKKNEAERLRHELNEERKKYEEAKVSRNFLISGLNENLEELIYSLSKAIENKKTIERNLSETTSVTNVLKENVPKIKSEIECTSKIVCEKDKEMSVLLESLISQEEINPDILDQKKRLQESYQSKYTKWCAEDEKFVEEMNSKNIQIENIKTSIYEVKQMYIVPIKHKINEYRGKFEKYFVECKVLEEKKKMFEEEECKLRYESSNLIQLQEKVKLSLSEGSTSVKKLQHCLDIRSKSAIVLSSQEYPVSPKISKSTSFLPPTNFTTYEPELSLDEEVVAKATENYRILQEELQYIFSKDVYADRTACSLNTNLQRIQNLRERESALRQAVTLRWLQVDPLQQAIITLSFAYLSKVVLMSTMIKKEAGKRRRRSSLPIRKIGEYIDISSKELHAQFSKLLFL